jgi:hypothetical protein
VLVAVILIGIYRPFTSREAVTMQLDDLYAKVADGNGEYSKKYYRVLDRFDRKLGSETTGAYESRMHSALDAGFQENLALLSSGQISLYDYTREWANYFPEREERKARRQLAQNALVEGVGDAMGEAAQSVINGVRDLVGKGADVVREKALGEGADSSGDDASDGQTGDSEAGNGSGSF